MSSLNCKECIEIREFQPLGICDRCWDRMDEYDEDDRRDEECDDEE
jgi:hypothetical protein